jgi:hypothetical protein
LRCESVQGIIDAIGKGLTDANSVGERVVMPASFTGGRRYHVMNYQDAMAICRVYSPPDLFVTFTCNSKWREIAYALRFEPGQQPCDRSDLVVRVFHMKVDEFIEDIREGETFGPIRAGRPCSTSVQIPLPAHTIFVSTIYDVCCYFCSSIHC